MRSGIKSVSLTVALFMLLGVIGCSANLKTTQGKTYKIGDRGPAGGWIFYDKGSVSDGWRYLEAAPKDQGKTEWGCTGQSIPGAKGTAIGTGKSNTAAIIAGCGKSGIAAEVASAYRGGGKSDWFLPSKDELDMMHANLHKAGVGGFTFDMYWCSSESNAMSAWLKIFLTGGNIPLPKDSKHRVRAIRAF